ncbi:MAG: polyamine aminopropyltransferase [Leptospiraceae bacterium]|nr:polyamine aminopropyltransferase [Leptospiraceae bacterium]
MGYFFKSGKVLYEGKTKFQDLEVHETPRFGKMLRLDGVFQTSEKDEFLYHEPLAHVPGMSIDGPKTALVIGGGDGGAAEEILKYPTIEKVVMVELDGGVVDACKQYIPEICKNTFDHPKFELRIEDGIKYVKNAPMKFDQVFIDLTDPFGPSIELYTVEFYSAIRDLLTERGSIGLHIESPVTRPELFSKLYYTLKEVFSIVRPMTNYVPFYGTLWGYAFASNSIDPLKIDKSTIQSRIEKFSLPDLQFYNADTHFSLMSLPNWIQKLLAEKQTPIHSGDSLPVPAGSIRNLVLSEY